MQKGRPPVPHDPSSSVTSRDIVRASSIGHVLVSGADH
jgi:hypothetical protein